jgi:hypothetical protein
MSKYNAKDKIGKCGFSGLVLEVLCITVTGK